MATRHTAPSDPLWRSAAAAFQMCMSAGLPAVNIAYVGNEPPAAVWETLAIALEGFFLAEGAWTAGGGSGSGGRDGGEASAEDPVSPADAASPASVADSAADGAGADGAANETAGGAADAAAAEADGSADAAGSPPPGSPPPGSPRATPPQRAKRRSSGRPAATSPPAALGEAPTDAELEQARQVQWVCHLLPDHCGTVRRGGFHHLMGSKSIRGSCRHAEPLLMPLDRFATSSQGLFITNYLLQIASPT